MCGRPRCRHRRASATGLLRVGPPWAGAEAAEPQNWCVARCSTTALAGAVPCSCVRGTRGRCGGGGWSRCRVFCRPCYPPPAPRSRRCVWRAVPSGCLLPLLARYAIPCGLCVPRARSGCPSGIPRLTFVCACARALAASMPLYPPRVGVARAPRLVPVLGAGRAVPCGLCPSACPASIPCAVWLAGGRLARSRSPLAWLGVVCPLLGGPARPGRSGARGGWGGGRGLCAVPRGGVAGGRRGARGHSTSVRPSAFPGRATKRVSLASLRSWRAWPPFCSYLCLRVEPGRGPCGALVRLRGSACLSRPPWEQAGGGVGACVVLA